MIVKFATHEIPKSPYMVGVSAAAGDASKCSARGPGIEKTGVTVNKKTYFEVITKSMYINLYNITHSITNKNLSHLV